MQRKLWLSIVMLAIGAALLVVAGLASPASSSSSLKAGKQLRKGGTIRIDMTEDLDDVDMARAYGTTAWEIEYVTALKLVDWPDASAPRGSRITPSAATYKVSNAGKRYTFTVKKGFRFSNGKPVTAKNFQYAFIRAASKEFQSPAYQFIADPSATFIVGIDKVHDAGARSASGVRVSGNKLIITLRKADATFLTKATMPFFQATDLSMPRDRAVITINDKNDMPTAGPYYWALRDPDRAIVLKRNTFYKGNRPHNAATLSFRCCIQLEAIYREVLANEADYGLGLPPTAHAELRSRFGVNRAGGRYQVRAINCTSYLALNNSHPLFRNNPQLRKAVNYVISRQNMVNLGGVLAGQPTDQLLPNGFPGFVNANLYPLKAPNVAKARSLSRGHTRNVEAKYFYTRRAPSPDRMEINRQDLSRIGINIEPKSFAGFDIYDAMDTRGSDHAIGQAGWCQDYPDPYDFINILLSGDNIQADNNNNLSYFNIPSYNRKMRTAAQKIGKARYNAYAALEKDIFKNQAPLANWLNPNFRMFFSNRIDMRRSFVYQSVYEAPDYATLALK